MTKDDGTTRKFDTGATRDSAEGKYDYEGFFCPDVLERYGEYMDKNRVQSDGGLRDSDNWQKGIPLDQYVKSAWRHLHKWWQYHRHPERKEAQEIEDHLCGLIFNSMGYLHELIKEDHNWDGDGKEGLREIIAILDEAVTPAESSQDPSVDQQTDLSTKVDFGPSRTYVTDE